MRAAHCLLIVSLLFTMVGQPRSLAADSGVAALFEDGADALLKQLTNAGGDTGGQGFADGSDVYSGTTSLRITDYQRYSRNLEGWKYRICKEPHSGEYRYLRFAWKKTGGKGVMIQLHDERDWNIRYVAGANIHGWDAKSVADTEPANWTVVTCDLFQDFGECTLTGMALTSFAGSAHFDHIYLGRSIDDLDRIDVVGLRRPGQSLPLAADQLEGLWTDLISDNAANVYRSVWTLTAGPDAAVPFLKGKLPATGPGARVDPKQFRQWILELDHDSFLVRERASKALRNHLTTAIPLLRKELEQPKITPEVRLRIGQLLKLAAPEDISPERRRLGHAIRVLEHIATPEARSLLTELANNEGDISLASLSDLALKRLSTRE